MSLSINIDKVELVLLNDGWHVVKNHSLVLDSYEMWCEETSGELPQQRDYVLKGGQATGVCAIGFSFIEDIVLEEGPIIGSYRVAGPLTSILAVKITK